MVLPQTPTWLPDPANLPPRKAWASNGQLSVLPKFAKVSLRAICLKSWPKLIFAKIEVQKLFEPASLRYWWGMRQTLFELQVQQGARAGLGLGRRGTEGGKLESAGK